MEKLDLTEGIAIIGMAGRFPGARDLDAYWRNLSGGVESISFFTAADLPPGVDPAVLNHPTYVAARGMVEGIEWLDAAFFGFNPREAEMMDPQHRLFLECAWEALEHAGYDTARYEGAIGVFAGAGINTYLLNNLYPALGPIESIGNFQVFLGNDKDFLTTRVSYKLNLRGPSITVQTACSTSLVAVCLAFQNLQSYQCDIALAGGVTLVVPQTTGTIYQEGGISSPDGHCRAFDAQAKGFVGGNGVGVVVLKRLADAVADGDTIHAVIKGVAINNDGAAKVGYTAPSVTAQAEVIALAQAVAGVSAATISYVETHGTGTFLGDQVEVAALTQAFRASTAANGFCAIGSVKTNIGHLDTAAGVAGLLKTVLALKHQNLPPSLHFAQPNPHIDFASTPFYVNARLAPWPAGQTPRRAGVSSFGIGGTNAHIILEEAPPEMELAAGREYNLLLLSAPTASALDSMAANLARHLRQLGKGDPRPSRLADVAYTLQVGRRTFNHRRALVCRDRDEAIAALETLDTGRVVTRLQETPAGSLIFMFPGGGAQHVNMALGLYQEEALFRDEVDHCLRLLEPRLGSDLPGLLYPAAGQTAAASEQLERTSIALPALFVIEYALAKLWMAWGIHPQALIGHSLGEYVAACLAGVISLEDALALVSRRGQLLDQLPAGAMLNISLPEAKVRSLLEQFAAATGQPRLEVAAVNTPSLCVVSGADEAVAGFEEWLKAEKIACRRLKIAVAAHSAMVTPILETFRRFIETLALRPPTIPYLSNVTGTWITAVEATDPAYWVSHLRQTVRFAEGIQLLLQDPKAILLEVGPGRTLATLAQLHSSRHPHQLVVSSLPHPHDPQADQAALLSALGQLWTAGVEVKWNDFHRQPRRRVPLPTYPFERQRYWIEPAGSRPGGQLRRSADLADWFYIPSWKRSLPPASPPEDMAALPESPQANGWLLFSDGSPLAAELVRRLEQAGHEVVTVVAGAKFEQRAAGHFAIHPAHAEEYQMLLQMLTSTGKTPDLILHLWSLTAGDDEPSGRARFQACQERGYYSLLFLAQGLNQYAANRKITVAVVADRLHDVSGQEVVWPEKMTLLAPCQIMAQESPHLTYRVIDLGPPQAAAVAKHQPSQLAEQLLAEIQAHSPDPVVAYRGRQRWIQVFEKIQLEPEQPPARALRRQGVYLITGGLGRIGLLLAEYLAGAVQARLVLVGRSPLPEREKWEAWLAEHDDQDETVRRLRQVMTLEASGAEIVVLNADVADENQMQVVIKYIEQRFGQLHGVIHAAGALQEAALFRPLMETEREHSEAQFRAKVYGTYVLAKVLGSTTPDFCLLFSSNAAVLGGLGLTAYAAANRFLDAFAAYQGQRAAFPWISANWDGWLSHRPSSEEGPRTSIDEFAMLPADGCEAFRRIVTQSTVSQVVVSAGDLTARLALWTGSQLSSAKQAANNGRVAYARPELRTAYTPPRDELEQTMARLWGDLLGIAQVGIHDNFFELGGHSLLATQLMFSIQDTFKVELPLRALFESPTVADLVVALVQEQAANADSDLLVELLAELDQLPEEAAQQLAVERTRSSGDEGNRSPVGGG